MYSKGNIRSKDAYTASRSLVKVQGREVEVGSNKNWIELLASFISSQDVSESSRKLYTRTLSQYFVWMERESKSLSTLTRKDVLEYKDYLQEQSLSSLTISSYITAVRKFYEWA